MVEAAAGGADVVNPDADGLGSHIPMTETECPTSWGVTFTKFVNVDETHERV
jgi:hypothetical protein